MIKNIKEKKNLIAIALYVVSSITALYTLFSIYNSYMYISTLVNSGSLIISEQLMSVVSYYMNTSMPYVFYTIVIWGIGYIISKLDSLKANEVNIEANTVEENINVDTTEEELDRFVNELKSDE